MKHIIGSLRRFSSSRVPVSRAQREFRDLCYGGLLLSIRSLTRHHRIGQVSGILTGSLTRNHTDVVGWLTTEGRKHVYIGDVYRAHTYAQETEDHISMRAIERGWPDMF